MNIEKRLKLAFPGHDIQMKQMPENIGIGTYSIFYDGNLLRIKFNDFSEMIMKLDHHDIRESEFQKLVREIKLELSRLPEIL